MDEPLDDIKADIEQLDLIEDLQERLDTLEKKYERLRQTLHWGLGGVIALIIIFNGAF